MKTFPTTNLKAQVMQPERIRISTLQAVQQLQQIFLRQTCCNGDIDTLAITLGSLNASPCNPKSVHASAVVETSRSRLAAWPNLWPSKRSDQAAFTSSRLSSTQATIHQLCSPSLSLAFLVRFATGFGTAFPKDEIGRPYGTFFVSATQSSNDWKGDSDPYKPFLKRYGLGEWMCTTSFDVSCFKLRARPMIVSKAYACGRRR